MALLSTAVVCVGCHRDASVMPRNGDAASDAVADVLAKIDSLAVRISLRPTEEDAQSIKLRSVMFSVPAMLREPSAQWPDGTPMSGYARITAEQARGIVERLKSVEFFEGAGKYHSERSDLAKQVPPPSGSERALPPEPRSPGATVTLIVHDSAWYTKYAQSYSMAETRKLLKSMKAEVRGDAAALLEKMLTETSDAGNHG